MDLNEAFEQLFDLGRGGFEQKFSQNSNARVGGEGGCLRFDLTGTLRCIPTWMRGNFGLKVQNSPKY